MNMFIFFFITFNLAATSKSKQEKHMRDIGIPHKSLIKNGPPKRPLEVIIRREGALQFRDSSGALHEVTLEGLVSEINKADFVEEPGQKTPSVIVVTNRNTAYGYVVKILDAVKKSKYKKIGLTASDFKE